MNPTYFFLILSLLGFSVKFTSAQQHQIRIACVGNSITYGSGLPDPSSQCYPAQLQVLLEQIYGDTCIVKNFSNPGRTMLKKGDLPLWNEKEFSDAYMYAPNICLILLGTNDSKPFNWDVHGDEFVPDYLSMIDTFLVRNPKVKFIVCYPPPAYETVYEISNLNIVNGVIPAIDSILKVRDAVLVDFYNPLVDSVNLFPDKIHPGIQGSVVMAELVRDKIIESDIIHQAETGLAFITEFTPDRYEIPVHDSVYLTWNSVNADSVWLNGTLVELLGSKKVPMNNSDYVSIIAKGKKNTDTVKIFIETYKKIISRLQIMPFSAAVTYNDIVDLELWYYDQNNVQIDTLTDIDWSISEGEGELFSQDENKIKLNVGNQNRLLVKAQVGEVSTSATFRVTTTGLNEKGEELLVVIRTSPLQNQVNIDVSDLNFGEAQLYILDLKGAVLDIKHYIIQSSIHNEFVYNYSYLRQGAYVCRLIVNDNLYTSMFIK